MENAFLERACEWFVTRKAPDLAEKVKYALESIKIGVLPQGNNKKLVAFILFDYAVHMGPICFGDAEWSIEQLGVKEEFEEYAKSWIEYSNRNKKEVEQ